MVTALNLLIYPSPQLSSEESLLRYLDYDAHLDSLKKWGLTWKNFEITVEPMNVCEETSDYMLQWAKVPVFVSSEQFIVRCIEVLLPLQIEIECSPAPTFVEIPEMTKEDNTYIDVYKLAYISHCCLCKKKGELLLCLVCGEKFCRAKCADEMPDKQNIKENQTKVHGNGAKHAYLCHGGRCVFFDVYTARYFAYDTLKIGMFSHGYKNVLGREVNIKDIEYDSLQSYYMNKPVLQKLEKAFHSGSLRQMMMGEVERLGRQVVDHSI